MTEKRLLPDYTACVNGLIKALQDYITLNDNLLCAQLRAGEITIDEAKADAAESQRFVEMRDDLIAFHQEAEVYLAMQERAGRLLS